MKKLIILFLFGPATLLTFGQDTIDVVEKTIKIGGLSKDTEYYGFAEGDKVVFNLIIEHHKDLKDITISEYPNGVKFADHAASKIQNKILNVMRKGIYVFEYYNSNISGRIISVKIQRIPKSEDTRLFNTDVKWINAIDTTYSAKKNTYLVSSDTSLVEVIDSKVRVHSETNTDNPNKTVVDFTIPANTVKWTYWIGVDSEGQKAFQQDAANFSRTGAKIFNSIDPLAGLAFGYITMTHASVGHNVKYYFLLTGEDEQKFMTGQPFMQFKSGDVVTDFALINYPSKNNQRYYIGLVNNSFMQGIDVNVKILAVVVNNKYNTVTEKVATYTNESIPVNED